MVHINFYIVLMLLLCTVCGISHTVIIYCTYILYKILLLQFQHVNTHQTITYRALLYLTVLCCTIPYCTLLYHTIWYHTVLYHTVPYHNFTHNRLPEDEPSDSTHVEDIIN